MNERHNWQIQNNLKSSYFSSTGFEQDCSNLRYNLSFKWWKYDPSKRRQCYMWLGFSLLVLLVVIAMSVIISKLTGGLDITEQGDFQEAANGMKTQAFVLYI